MNAAERVPVRAVFVRLLVVGVFLGTYVTVWRPARDWASARVLAPLLAQVDTERARRYEVRGAPSRAVEVRRANAPPERPPVASMAAPTGLLFVIGSVFLLALYPTRLYWLYLGLYQWALGGLLLGLLAVGIGWADGGFRAFAFLSEDVYRGTSLGLPLVFAWLDARRPSSDGESSSPA